MKVTGKIKEDSFGVFTKRPALKNGRKTPCIWALIADGYFARFYRKNDTHMELLGEAEPDQKIFKSEVSNKTMGRTVRAAGRTIHHKFEPHIKKNGQAELQFAYEIADFLERAEKTNIFDRLIVVAAPKMLGNLRSNFSKPIQNRIVAEIDKDFTKLKDKELEKALKKIIWF